MKSMSKGLATIIVLIAIAVIAIIVGLFILGQNAGVVSETMVWRPQCPPCPRCPTTIPPTTRPPTPIK